MEVDSIRDLGVMFTCDLSFDLHIKRSVGIALQKLGFVVRGIDILDV